MLDRSVIQKILPHRPPFLFIDHVEHYSGLPKPFILAETSTCFSKDKYLLDETNSFWPNAYVIEGLGQCFLLLSIFYKIEAEHGINIAHGSSSVERILDLLDTSGHVPKQHQNNGLLAHVDLTQHKELEVGKKIQYRIDLNMNQGKLYRYKVDARVDNEPVVDGFMIGSQF